MIPGEGLYRTQILSEKGAFDAITKTFPKEGVAECMISGDMETADGSDAMIVFRAAY